MTGGGPQRTTLSISSGPLVGPVLARVVGMLAARADLPVDRLDDAVLVADSIAACAPAYVRDGQVVVAVDTAPGGLELKVGPLQPGGGQSLLCDAAVPGVGNVVERLTDDIWTSQSDAEGGGEYLHLKVATAS
jgi:serine/threonine-protein kinase RsbW